MDTLESEESSLFFAGQETSDCCFHSDFQVLFLISPDVSSFKISSIRVHLSSSLFTSLITGIEFSYVNTKTGETLRGKEHHGTQNGRKIEEVRLGNDEFVTGIFGNCQNHIHRLVFKTSRGRLLEFGSPQKQEFSLEEKPETHLTAARVGTSKAIRFLAFQRVSIKPTSLVSFQEIPKKDEGFAKRQVIGNQLADGRRFSDFRMFDLMGLSAYATKVEQIFIELDSFAITSLRFSYTDTNNMKYRGIEAKGSMVSTEKKRIGLENYEFLVAAKAFSSKFCIFGVQLSLNTGKVINVGNFIGDIVTEIIAPSQRHLTAFEMTFEDYCENISGFSAPMESFLSLFGKSPVPEQSVKVIEEGENAKEEKQSQRNKASAFNPEANKSFFFGPGTLIKSKMIGENPSEMAVYFDDMPRFKEKQLSLVEIVVFFDSEGICGIMTTYSDEKGFLSQGGSTLFPLDNRKSKRLILEEKEKVIETSGSLKGGFISHLGFKSTRGKTLEVGEVSETPFQNMIKPSCFLCGFGGFVEKHLESFFVYQT